MNIDVIIPVYKPNKWVLESIDSVFNQTYSDWHITIVDDCTPLPNAIIDQIQKLSNENKKITYIRLFSNCRAAEARNIGIKQSKGDMIAFLDQDDKWLPEKLEHVIKYFKTNHDIKLVHSDIEGINGIGELILNEFKQENERRKTIPYTDIEKKKIVKELFCYYSVRLGTIVVEKEAFEKVGGFDSGLFGGEDEEFIVRFASEYKVGHLPEILTFRRIHSQNVSKLYKDKRVVGKLKAIEKMGQRYPYLGSVFKESHKKIIRKAIRLYFIQNNKEDALRYSCVLIKMTPFDPKAYTLFILSLFKINPEQIYKNYMKIKTLFRTICSRAN